MIDIIQHNGNSYPAFQANGNAARFCMPFAAEVLKGCSTIFDICPAKPEWSYPGSILIDKELNDEYHAMNLPPVRPDGIFCSHGLEHLERPFEALEYWHLRLKTGGKLFLYLPNMDTQTYWRPWSNKKHLWYCNDSIMRKYFKDNQEMWGWSFVSEGSDLYNSFICVAEKI